MKSGDGHGFLERVNQNVWVSSGTVKSEILRNPEVLLRQSPRSVAQSHPFLMVSSSLAGPCTT